MAESAKGDAGAGQVQSNMDKINEQGFRGPGPIDPTPNSAYTVAGVTSGDATPETDADAEAEARKAAGVGSGPIAATQAEAEATAKAGKSSKE